MYFRLLGPIRVETSARRLGKPIPPGEGTSTGGVLSFPARRQQVVLGLLLVELGKTVSAERMIDAVWAESPPATARVQVQNCVGQLRRTLQAARCEGHPSTYCHATLVASPHGYRLDADRSTVDAVLFESAVQESLRVAESCDHQVAAALRRSLDLWTGPTLGGGFGALELEAEAARLDDLKLVAIEELASRELQLGHPPELCAAGLLGLTRRYPHRERLWLLYMEALRRSGRAVEALAKYREYRSMLLADLGIEPGKEIRDKERDILRAVS